MSIDSVIADLEARLLFEAFRLDSSSRIGIFRQPSRLAVNQQTRTMILRAGFVAKDFVVGFPERPIEPDDEGRATLWLAPLANVISVRRLHRLRVPEFLHTETNERETGTISLNKYLEDWLGEQVLVTTANRKPEPLYEARSFVDKISGCITSVDRHSLLVADSDGELLIPFHSIESVEVTAGSVPMWKTGA